MLRRGMRWTVGHGEAIKYWKDPWLLGMQTRKIISPRGDANLEVEVEVKVLIDPISKEWKVDLC